MCVAVFISVKEPSTAEQILVDLEAKFHGAGWRATDSAECMEQGALLAEAIRLRTGCSHLRVAHLISTVVKLQSQDIPKSHPGRSQAKSFSHQFKILNVGPPPPHWLPFNE